MYVPTPVMNQMAEMVTRLIYYAGREGLCIYRCCANLPYSSAGELLPTLSVRNKYCAKYPK